MKNINSYKELNSKQLQSLTGGENKNISLMTGLSASNAFTKFLKSFGKQK